MLKKSPVCLATKPKKYPLHQGGAILRQSTAFLWLLLCTELSLWGAVCLGSGGSRDQAGMQGEDAEQGRRERAGPRAS